MAQKVLESTLNYKNLMNTYLSSVIVPNESLLYKAHREIAQQVLKKVDADDKVLRTCCEAAIMRAFTEFERRLNCLRTL